MTAPYVWTQTPSTVTILLEASPSCKGENVYVKVNEGKLAVRLFDVPVVEGLLTGTVIKDQGIWLLEEKRLIVHIRKRGKKLWDSLLSSDSLPETKGIHGPLSDAQVLLGRCYEEGENGLKKEYETSLECYVSAAELGNLASQLRVAFIYHAGKHYMYFPVDENPEEGFRFHMMAAEQHNHVEALCNVGNSYFQGVGTTKDHKKARDYYTRAAELIPPLVKIDGKLVPPPDMPKEAQQSLLSMFHLGLIYSQGEDGVERNPEEAFKWWRRAAKYKHPQSIYNMGVMLLSNGDQTPQNIILAFLYLKEANSLQPDLAIPEGFHFLEENLKLAAREQNMTLDELLTKMRLEVEELEQQAEAEAAKNSAPAGKIVPEEEVVKAEPCPFDDAVVVEQEEAVEEEEEEEVEEVQESSSSFVSWGFGLAAVLAVGFIGYKLLRRR